MKITFPFALLSLLMVSLWVSSCDPDQDFLTGDSVDVSFSLDTLRFDTVFTELGSATRSLKIFNNTDQPVKLDEVYVEGATGVDFRINVDGIPGGVVEDAIIWDNDSIWVFVEVTIDPDEDLSASPYVVEDQLVVKTGGKETRMLLEAWGQNANYFPSRFNKGIPVVLSCSGGTIRWDDEKPYVVYGEIFIDNCLLEVAAGTKIYVHGGIAENELLGVFNDGFFVTQPTGRMHLLGTVEDPIIVQGDRLEEGFQELSGQWLGLVFGPGSTGNIIENTVIKNGFFGVYADSTAEVTLRNSIIHTTASSALVGVHSNITAQNCLFYDNGANAVQLIHGGDYQFDHCSVASYGVDASALAMSNFRCYNDECTINSVYRLNADFRNCIFFGSRRDEIILQDAEGRAVPNLFQLNMSNCLVKVDELITRGDGLYDDFFATYCLDCVNGDQNDAIFLDRAEDNYRLDTLSLAQNQGIVIPGLSLDIEGTPRDAEPDLGCYERVD